MIKRTFIIIEMMTLSLLLEKRRRCIYYSFNYISKEKEEEENIQIMFTTILPLDSFPYDMYITSRIGRFILLLRNIQMCI